MTKEEHIDKDMEKKYSLEEITEILDKHILNKGLVQLRHTKNMTGHQIVESMAYMYSIIADYVHKNVGLYD